LILFGERSLQKALIQFQEHYHEERVTKARTTCCFSPPLLGLSPVGDVASAVENVSAAYSDTTVAPHEYFDQMGQRPAGRGGSIPFPLSELDACAVLLGLAGRQRHLC
jgi:hypothetical protein